MKKLISFIIPCYNPPLLWEDNLINNYRDIVNLLEGKYQIEVILINDGSIKTIFERSLIFDEIKAFALISNKNNRGKGYAVRKGATIAKGDIVLFTDVDFPYENRDILKAIEGIERGNDLIITQRDESYYKNIPKHRKFISIVLKGIIKTIFNLPTSDTQGGLKVFNQKGKEILLETKIDRYLFDLEFIQIAHKKGIKMSYIIGKLKKSTKISNVNLSILFNETGNLIRLIFKRFN